MADVYSHIEVKLGMFVAFCLALFVSMLITYGKVSPFWRARREINVVFENSNSLRPDSPVRYNGFEVGRVKSLRIIHLDNENLDRLAASITKRNLDNLPLRSDTLRRELRAATDEDFPAKCRAALQNLSMIELSLELMQEGDDKRFHVDDQARIVDTIFGDTAVEIFSGNGAINTPADPKLILGTSGDFFSNLSKSMGEVKEILSGVTDLVGMEERKSFLASQERFSTTGAAFDKMTALAGKRASASAERLNLLGKDATAAFGQANKLLEAVQPHTKRLSNDGNAAIADIKKRASDLETTRAETQKELLADARLIQDDVQTIINRSTPDFDPLGKNMRGVFDKLNGLSDDLDDVRNNSGWLYSQSEPEFARTGAALKKSLLNLRYFGEAAKENKDLMISRKDAGEHDFNTIVDTYKRMVSVMRRIHESIAEVQEVKSLLPRELAPPGMLAHARSAEQSLQAMQAPLDDVYSQAGEKMLPKFTRKKAAW